MSKRGPFNSYNCPHFRVDDEFESMPGVGDRDVKPENVAFTFVAPTMVGGSLAFNGRKMVVFGSASRRPEGVTVPAMAKS